MIDSQLRRDTVVDGEAGQVDAMSPASDLLGSSGLSVSVVQRH
jgi:hypothetical protein